MKPHKKEGKTFSLFRGSIRVLPSTTVTIEIQLSLDKKIKYPVPENMRYTMSYNVICI